MRGERVLIPSIAEHDVLPGLRDDLLPVVAAAEGAAAYGE